MKDAKLLNRKNETTALCYDMKELYPIDSEAVWQIIWLNLCLNSPLFNFYVSEILWGSAWTKAELVALIEKQGYAKRTAINAANALTNTFENSPFGDWFGRKLDKRKYLKTGLRVLSPPAMKYALSILGENQDYFEKIFGINEKDFYYNILRSEPLWKS